MFANWKFNQWFMFGFILLAVVLVVIVGVVAANQSNTLPDGRYHLTCSQAGQKLLDVYTYGPVPVQTSMRMGTTMWAWMWHDQNGNPQYYSFSGQIACRPEYLGPNN